MYHLIGQCSRRVLEHSPEVSTLSVSSNYFDIQLTDLLSNMLLNWSMFQTGVRT